ncbi:MAG: dihydroxyacetone kinase transcriptional activator DhaS [Lachnospiraceae bacterium]|nr:dihydroxyacetone kinase transcriptional activator DhaS [Lachnospiraceae bacterium]
MSFLADSNITKRALSAALKELMESCAFSKISVADICERCDMHRKSFYYHFRDKYDLVNWIYYTEFVTRIQQKEYRAGWDLLEYLCDYFYENRAFYRKTLGIEGQNSFSEYFRDIVVSIISEDLEEIFKEDDAQNFYVDFYADAFVCAIKRWLLDKNCIPSAQFSHLLKKCLLGASDKIVRDFSEEMN